jgi:hypothetical protein
VYVTTDTIIQNYLFHHYYNHVYMNKTIRLKNSFSISFSQTADWQRFRDLWNNIAFCQSAAQEKEIEKEFGNNSRTSPLASSKRLDSDYILGENSSTTCSRVSSRQDPGARFTNI